MLDEEYLEKAGIKDPEAQAPANTIEAPQAENTSAPAVSDAAQSNQGVAPAAPGQAPVAKTAAQKAIEMFELAGQKFPVNTKFKIAHGGKILEVPYDNLVNKYRLSEHLEDKFKKFGEEQKSFAQMKAEADAAIEFKNKYGKLQDWSEKNPQDWQTLWDLYQNKDKHILAAKTQGQSGTMNAGIGMPQNQPNLQPILEKLQSYEEKLSKYDQLANQFNEQQTQVQEQRDTEFVKNEMADFQKDFPEINLQERDPDGVALWAKIIQWGLQNRYTDFKPAARMFLQQRVDDVIASRARAEALKGVRTQNANGIMKRSPTPFNTNGKEGSAPANIRKLSYSQLAELSKEQVRNLG